MSLIFKYVIGFFDKFWSLKIPFLPLYYQLWSSNFSYIVFLLLSFTITLFLKIPFRRFTIYDFLFIFT